MVPLLNTLTVDAGTGGIICEGNSIVLNATSNGNNFLWNQTGTLSNAGLLQPTATPGISTTYIITARLGPCTEIDSATIFVKPAPQPFAADASICYGQTVRLNATGGISYSWIPATYLSSTNIPNPQVMKPASTIVYDLHAIGSNNCPSIQPSKVKVTVTFPIKIFAGNDTAALVNEPLQLNAVDFNNNPVINWVWSPSAGLNNPLIPNPVFVSDKDRSYLLTAVTPEGCEARDSITIKVYKFADIFVPTAFTPNGDGKNEVLKAQPIGIKQFVRFSVYNRWGQLVFTTADHSKGWNGKISGVLQPAAVFVWIASAIDFKGRPIERKGTTVLIR
jgi:gliding motility-associated-like protein